MSLKPMATPAGAVKLRAAFAANDPAPPLPPVAYSLGRDTYDNRPKQHEAATFAEFRDVVLATQSPKKGLAFVCAAFAEGESDNPKNKGANHWRGAKLAQPRRWFPFDVDKIDSREAFDALMAACERWSGLAYETASSTADAPRCRIILELSRPVTREEGELLGPELARELTEGLDPVKYGFDGSVYRSEQPCYTPTKDAARRAFNGRPVNPDGLLLRARLAAASDEPEECVDDEADGELGADVRAALPHIDPEDRETWLRVGMALHSTGAPEAWDTWCEWSRASSKFKEAVQRETWASFHGKSDGIGLGTLFKLAADGGWVRPKRYKRQRIEHFSGSTQVTTDKVLEHLRDADLFFDRGSELVYADGEGLHRTNGAALAYALAKHVRFVQPSARGKGDEKKIVDQPIDPPPAVLQQIAAIDRGLKRIRAAVTAPVMAPDGRIVQQYGHDAGTDLYIVADCGGVKVPECVSESVALAALGTLWHPFREFDCATNLDRGVLLAAILTAIERPALSTAPGFAMDAPLQGSGKTYLAQCLAALAQGSLPAVDPPVDDENEIRKRLLSAALAAPAVIVWDNLVGTLRSAALAAFLTSETYTDRVLGESRSATGETRILFLCTGNNVQLAGDMPRRVLRCRLDAHTENPETRVFHDNPRGDILRRRHELVQAGLTLMRGHQQSDWKPTSTTASFEAWDALVRQCVAWVASLKPDQFQDPGDAFMASKDDDPEREELAELLDGLVAVLDVGALAANDGWFTAKDVWMAVDDAKTAEAAGLRATLQPLCAHGLSPKAIGRVLTFRKDRQIGGRCLRARTMKGYPTGFRIDTGLV